jgi:hypothetical protein
MRDEREEREKREKRKRIEKRTEKKEQRRAMREEKEIYHVLDLEQETGYACVLAETPRERVEVAQTCRCAAQHGISLCQLPVNSLVNREKKWRKEKIDRQMTGNDRDNRRRRSR